MRLALLLPFLLTACGKVYDVDTWRSPLASEYDGDGDATKGEQIYNEEHWTDSTGYAFTCHSCHANDTGDTLLVDAGDLNRPAHTTYNAPWRETWKINQSWDEKESTVLGGYGGQVCVSVYFPSGAAMTAEQAAHLEAYMRTMMDADPGEDERASPLDYAFNTWSTNADFVASVQDDTGAWLYGTDIGDPTNGEALVGRFCGACHIEEGDTAPTFYTPDTLDLGQIAARIRKTDVGDSKASNARMPRVTWDRLSDDDLADVLAFLTAGREGT